MRSAYIEIIEDCNLQCIFCSRGDKCGVASAEKVKKLLKKYKEEGYKKAILTGGEPLLHKDLEKLIAYGVSLGFEVAIQTNGTLITPEKARALKKTGVDQIIFSIHAHIPELVDEIMRGKGVLEKQLQGLENCHKEDVFLPVTTLVLRNNYKLLPEFFRFMIEKYPFVSHFTLNFVDPIGRSKENKKVVPKISEVERHLMKSLLILKNAEKTFRIERVPLCYIPEFAEYNTELRRIWTKEPALVHRERKSISYDEGYFGREYVWGKACEYCWLKPICPGIDIHYAQLYGTEEVFPIFIEPQKILKDAGED